MDGVAKVAPKPKPARMSQRLLPTLDEVFDLAEAIAGLGPRMSDGRFAGERFRSLILCAGTLGPRPGELGAHRPEWIDWDAEPPAIRFHETEAGVYDARKVCVGVVPDNSSSARRASSGRCRCCPRSRTPAGTCRARVLRAGPHVDGRDRQGASGLGEHGGRLLASRL